MANTDLRVGGTSGLGGQTHGMISRWDFTLDFAVTNAGATDTFQLMNIPAGATVLSVIAVVETVEGGVATVDIGDAALATRYFTNLDINALSGAATATPFYQLAADVLTVTTDTAATGVAKLRVSVILADTASTATT